jgi:hypothetical protein
LAVPEISSVLEAKLSFPTPQTYPVFQDFLIARIYFYTLVDARATAAWADFPDFPDFLDFPDFPDFLDFLDFLDFPDFLHFLDFQDCLYTKSGARKP